MRITWNGKRYEAASSYDEKDILKAAKWRWDVLGRVWWTDDLKKLIPLRSHIDDSNLLAKLGNLKEEVAVQRKQNREVATKLASLSCATDYTGALTVPDGSEYLPFQRAGIAYALEVNDALIADDMGLGKGQPASARLLTPNGWVQFGDVEVGTKVIGKDGGSHNVTGVFRRGVLPVFRVTFSDHSSILCDEDHLWTVNTPLRNSRGTPPKTLSLRDIRIRGLVDSAGNRQHFIPMVSPIAFTVGSPLPIDPYVLGVLLGDGTLTQRRVSFSKPDEDMGKEVASRLPSCLTLLKSGPSSCWTWTVSPRQRGGANPIRDALGKLSLLGCHAAEKSIPTQYLFASIEDRLSLLRGLCDTDGHVREDNNVEYSTSSKDLAEGVRFLVESLGGTARVRVKSFPSYSYKGEKKIGQPSYRMSICLPNPLNPFLLPRKALRYQGRVKYGPARSIISIEPAGREEVVCISVDAPDQLYVTEHCIVTHNTVQALGVINNDPSISKVLIVCPASLKINWARHCVQWLVRPFTVRIATPKEAFGPAEPFRAGNPGLTITIVNYDIVGRFDYGHVDLMILDESHQIKNPNAKRTIAILGREAQKRKGIPAVPGIQARKRLFLTGTPICNRPKEFWTIAHACAPDIFSSFFTYAKRYCAAVQNGYGWDFSGASNLEELQAIARSRFMCRRLKTEVLKDLPPKRRQIIELPSAGLEGLITEEAEMVKRIEAARVEVRAEIRRAKAANDDVAYKAAVERLRAIQGLTFGEMSAMRQRMAIAKIPHVIAYLEDLLETGEKIVCFAHHKAVIDALMAHFGAQAVKVTGDVVKVEDRMAAVDRFQNDPTCRLFFGNILAAGVGLTLTASSTVVFAELDWVPGNVTQAEDRCHRIGQVAESVLVYHLVVDGSLDAKMAKTIIAKQAVIDRALNHDKLTLGSVEIDPFGDTDLDEAVSKAEAVVHEKQREKQEKEKAKAHTRVLPETPGGDKGKLATTLPTITPEQVQAILVAMRMLRDRCDGAYTKDGSGFNKVHAQIGRDFAGQTSLSPRQAAFAKKLVTFYQGQIPDALLAACGVTRKVSTRKAPGRR